MGLGKITIDQLKQKDSRLGELAISVKEVDGKHSTRLHPNCVLNIVKLALEDDYHTLRGVVSQLLDIMEKKDYFAPFNHQGDDDIIPSIRKELGLPEKHDEVDRYISLQL